jgi:hypothetical protein
MPRVPGSAVENPGVTLRFASRVELGDELIGELQRTVVAARQGGDLRGVFKKPEPIGPGNDLRVADACPQLESTAVVGLGLDRGVGELGRPRSLYRCRQRLGDPAGRMPVVSQLCGGQRRVLADGKLRVTSERNSDTLMEGGSFAGKEVAVHSLAAEGVAERVQLADPDHHLAANCVAKSRVERHRIQIADVA